MLGLKLSLNTTPRSLRGVARLGTLCSAFAVLTLLTGCPTLNPDPCASSPCADTDECTVDVCTADSTAAAGYTCTNDPKDCGAQVCNPADGVCVECVDASTCDDTLFCNGAETCGADNACSSAGDPCASGETCNEGTGACDTNCTADADCPDDTVFCNGTESCDLTDPTAGVCVHSNDACPDNGLFCDGVESCDTATDACAPSASPCATGETCTEGTSAAVCNACTACTVATEATDCPDDGVVCNGTESCGSDGCCTSSGDPCTAFETCNESTGVCDAVVNPGDTFAFTLSSVTGIADNLTGGTGDDTFNAAITGTLESGESADGLGGNDTLNARFTADAQTVQPTLNSIENVSIQVDGVVNKAFTFDMSQTTGTTMVILKDHTPTADAADQLVAFNNVAAGVGVGINGGSANTRLMVALKDATGTADEVTVTLDGGTNSPLANILTIAGVETVSVNSSGTKAATITTLTTAAATTLNVKATDSKLTLGNVDDATTTIDASASTSDTNISGVGNVNSTYTGGSADDRVDFGVTTFNANDVVDGGSGTDTIAFDGVTNTTALSLTGFERYERTDNGAAIDADTDVGNSITQFCFSGTGANVLNDAPDGTTVVMKGAATSYNLNVLTNTAADDITCKLNEGGTANLAVTSAALDVQQWDTVNLESMGASSVTADTIVNTVDTLTGTAGAQVNASGDQRLVITNPITTVSKLDGTNMTARLNATFLGNTNPVVANGGSKNDDLRGGGAIGGSSADVLKGNAGDDTLDGHIGANNLTGDDGADKFRIGNDFSSVTTITDFTPGTDELRLSKTMFPAIAGADGVNVASTEFASGAGLVTASSSAIRFIYNTTNGRLYYDADGNGATNSPVLFATLTGAPALTVSDMVMKTHWDVDGDTFVGSSTADTITGSGNADVFSMGDGADSITTGGGADTIFFPDPASTAGIRTITMAAGDIDGSAIDVIFDFTADDLLGTTVSYVHETDADVTAATNSVRVAQNVVVMDADFFADAAAVAAATWDDCGTDGEFMLIYSSTNSADARLALCTCATNDVTACEDVATFPGLTVVEAASGAGAGNFVTD